MRKKNEEWAERVAVNQKRESGWRERGEVSQMENERENGELAGSSGGGGGG